MEIWKDIKGKEGFYQVSDKGRVKSCERTIETRKGKRKYKSKLVKHWINENDYCQIDLYQQGVREHKKVHQLVADAFIPNLENKPYVDHINGNRQDNRVENLRWCTQEENNNFELYREHQKNNSKKSKIVYQYTLENELIAMYPSTMEVERKLGFDNSHVSACCRGKMKTYKGYKWSYLPL